MSVSNGFDVRADGERDALAELVRERMQAAYPQDPPLDPTLEVALDYSANLGGP
ncbi:hypothetical protein [Mycobacterium angelicum]|uniref:hypothetical protein n=1 Tax=Mycobacterium angelicum TaxID=470074 RepID=UPI001476276E|nr:hypothetical protein [Mycobacterium angelicum]MCV7199088.1 hypothetical protein [Mycobacterium angelicum]